MGSLSAFRIPQVPRDRFAAHNSLFGTARVLDGKLGEQPVRMTLRGPGGQGSLPPAGVRLKLSISNYEVQLVLADLSVFDAVRDLCGESGFLQLHSDLQLAVVRAVFQPVITALQAQIGNTVTISRVEAFQQIQSVPESERFELELSSGDKFMTAVTVIIPAELRETGQDFLSTVPVIDNVDVGRFEFDAALMAGFVRLAKSEFDSLETGDLLVLDAFNPQESNLDFIAGGCVIAGATVTADGVQITGVRPFPYQKLNINSEPTVTEPFVILTVGFQFGRLSVQELAQLQAGGRLQLTPSSNNRVEIWADGFLAGFGETVTHRGGVAIRLERIGRKAA